MRLIKKIINVERDDANIPDIPESTEVPKTTADVEMKYQNSDWYLDKLNDMKSVHGIRQGTSHRFPKANSSFAPTRGTVFVCEDSTAVIGMLRKGRSLAMRHIRRTHKVNLDLLCEIFSNNEGIINIRYVHTSLQVADIFTKGAYDPASWKRFISMVGLQTFHNSPLGAPHPALYVSCAIVSQSHAAGHCDVDGSQRGSKATINSAFSFLYVRLAAMAQDMRTSPSVGRHYNANKKARMKLQEYKQTYKDMETCAEDAMWTCYTFDTIATDGAVFDISEGQQYVKKDRVGYTGVNEVFRRLYTSLARVLGHDDSEAIPTPRNDTDAVHNMAVSTRRIYDYMACHRCFNKVELRQSSDTRKENRIAWTTHDTDHEGALHSAPRQRYQWAKTFKEAPKDKNKKKHFG